MRCIVACRPKRICPTRTRPGPSDSSSESCTYAIPRVSDCTPHRAVDCCFPDRFFPPPNRCNRVPGHHSGQRRLLLPPRSPPAQAPPRSSRPHPLPAGIRDLLLNCRDSTWSAPRQCLDFKFLDSARILAHLRNAALSSPYFSRRSAPDDIYDDVYSHNPIEAMMPQELPKCGVELGHGGRIHSIA